MREIVLNGRFLSRRVTGVERYGREILSRMENRCRVVVTLENGIKGHLWEQFVLPSRLKSNSILWSPANTGPLVVGHQALTIHDLSPLEHPEYFSKSFSTWYRLFLPLLAKHVRVVFTPSHYVQQKVKTRFNIPNVIVTANGVDTANFFPDALPPLTVLPDKYILFIGSLQPGKNLQVLLEAWRQTRSEYPDLWIVLGGERGHVFDKVKLTTDGRVYCLGYVPERDLPGLYAKARLFVLPSLEEGFGLPALEAMACGTPVIVSDGGALPEVVGDAALIFDKHDPVSLSAAIRSCLQNPDLSASLVARGFERIKKFSWQISAELIWNTLHEI